MALGDLHPAPVEYPGGLDHREVGNREQTSINSTYQIMWRRAVEQLAADLCIHPLQADEILRVGAAMVNKGLRWHWWDP